MPYLSSSACLDGLVSRKVRVPSENKARDPLYFKSLLFLGPFCKFSRRPDIKGKSHLAGRGNTLVIQRRFYCCFCTRRLVGKHFTLKWSSGEALVLPCHILKIKKIRTAAIAWEGHCDNISAFTEMVLGPPFQVRCRDPKRNWGWGEARMSNRGEK